MKYSFLFLCAFWVALAQETDDVKHRYFVPLPGTKMVASTDWRYQLELAALAGVEYDIQVVQYDIRGRVLSTTDFGTLPRNAVFSWDSSHYVSNTRLRSLEVVSNQKLQGLLWMSNDIFGQINGVMVSEGMAAELVIPHIPKNFFEMTTSFAVQGVSPFGDAAPVQFRFYDTAAIAHAPSMLRSLWPSFGYLTFTPEVTLSIGDLNEDVTAAWGQVFSENHYLLGGFQTFTKEAFLDSDVYTQTAANELLAEGRESGHFLFTSLSDVAFDEQLIFTNANSFEVRLKLELHTELVQEIFLPGEVEKTSQPSLGFVSETLVLKPYQKRELVIGRDIFTDTVGRSVRLAFQANRVLEPSVVEESESVSSEPAKVFALHLQDNESLAWLGSHYFSRSGMIADTWISRHEDSESLLEITTTGVEKAILQDTTVDSSADSELPEDVSYVREFSEVDIAIFNEEYSVLTRHIIYAGDTFSIASQKIKEIFGQNFEDFSFSPVRVRVEVLSGAPIIAKLTTFKEGDIAIVNPFISDRPDLDRDNEQVMVGNED